jgi:outer membrane protein assembly factor BamB
MPSCPGTTAPEKRDDRSLHSVGALTFGGGIDKVRTMKPAVDCLRAVIAGLAGLLMPLPVAMADGSAAVATPALEWPQFRGPGGQGHADGSGPRVWTREKGIAWKIALPAHGWSSPVISAGKLVLTGSRKKDETTILSAFAIDTGSGELLWSTDLFEPRADEMAAMHGKNSLASPTPVIGDDGVVYVHFGHMGTAALRLGNGEVVWKQQISYKPMHGNGGSPVLVGDLLIANADAEVEPSVFALHCKDGSVAWRTPRAQEVRSMFSFSTPLVINHGGRREILSAGSGMIGAYAPEDGKLLWKVEYGEGYSVVPRPVVANGMVYVSTGYNIPRMLAIRLEGAEGNVTGSHVVWEVNRRMPKTPSMIATGGQLLVLDDTGTLTALDGSSGKSVWTQRLPGNFSASPILAGSILYVPTEDGVCYVVEISPEGARIISEVDMAERMLASPVLLGGALFLRSEATLWKIIGES